MFRTTGGGDKFPFTDVAVNDSSDGLVFTRIDGQTSEVTLPTGGGSWESINSLPLAGINDGTEIFGNNLTDGTNSILTSFHGLYMEESGGKKIWMITALYVNVSNRSYTLISPIRASFYYDNMGGVWVGNFQGVYKSSSSMVELNTDKTSDSQFLITNGYIKRA